jgi:ribonuclease P protein component
VLEQLFRDGQTLYVHPVKLYYATTGLPADITLQAGFGVPSRTFRKAVERNRIKRLMREGYRLQKSGLQAAIEGTNGRLALFFLYTAKEQPTFELMKEKIGIVLEKLEKTISPSTGLRRAKPGE